jgi:predicted Zn-dependent peptidase
MKDLRTGAAALAVSLVLTGASGFQPAHAHSAAAQRPPAPIASAGVSLPHQIARLENGLTLVMQPDPSLPNVGVELWIGGGAREEKAGQFGFAHLFEHQLAGAPTLVGSNQENRALAARGLRGSGAGAEPDLVNIYRIVAPESLEVMLATLADQLDPRPSKFTEERVNTDEDIVLSELRRNFSIDWHSDVRMHLRRGTFGADHPYGHVDF